MAKGRGGFIGQDGLNAPDSPTGVSGTGGNTQVDVSFTAPTDVGGSAITGYRVTDSTGSHGASGSSSPITVTGLTNDTSYTFNVWAINAFGYSAPSDSTGSVTPSFQRAVIAGGWNGSENNVIDYVSITSTGNATDFGDLVITRRNYGGGIGSTTRGVFTGGYNPSVGPDAASMDYITFASTGNAADFGDMFLARRNHGMMSNNTRGLSFGDLGAGNDIEYITIASTGNGTDFGNLTQGTDDVPAGSGSSTRGVIGGGSAGGNVTNVISYITFGSTGNATDFGDLSLARRYLASSSSSTRAIFGGGSSSTSVASFRDEIDYITIASTGNAADFGDLSVAGQSLSSTSGGNTRSIFTGRKPDNSSDGNNVIDYVTIASTGNATDFGDLTVARSQNAATSNSHGGVQ
jgi:hypothetical protein